MAKNSKKRLEAFFRSEITEEEGFDAYWDSLGPLVQAHYETADLDAIRAEQV